YVKPSAKPNEIPHFGLRTAGKQHIFRNRDPQPHRRTTFAVKKRLYEYRIKLFFVFLHRY
ncbi:MAG TPA: hypothetical protein H9927_07375, partial [Candidatus Alistipes merdipullorum]|nr:hypothetical protein [Candidatus Alistipes merdipullorum]